MPILLLLVLSIPTWSQEISVNSGFIEDSLKIGEPIHYYLTATYPEKFEVIFPDSTYSFGSFEEVSKQFYVSKLDSSTIQDSIVYEFLSFEIDPWQKLQLPVFLITQIDSVKIFSTVDSIRFIELAKNVTDSTALKSNLAFNDVDEKYNYNLLYTVIFVVLGALILGLAFFGKRIGNHFRLQRLKRNYTRFSDTFEDVIHNLKTNNSPEIAESGINLWKKYLEKLDNKPYTKLTTKELIDRSGLNDLETHLKNIDRSVYGGIQVKNIHQDFEKLEDIISEKYMSKVNHIKHG